MTENIQLQPGEVKELPVSMIQEDLNQPREDFDEEKIEGIAASIKARRSRGLRGLIQPIKVLGNGLGGYIIKSGANRYRATLRADEEVIACELDDETEDTTPVDRLIDQVSENYNRSDLNAIELAKVIDRLRNEGGLTLKETEERLNAAGIKLQRAALTNTHRLLKLPPWAQEAVRRGEITPAHGKYLLQVEDFPALLDTMEKWLSEFVKEEGRCPTTPEWQDQIAELYAAFFPRIPQDEYNRWSGKFGYIRFDTTVCLSECKKSRKLGAEGKTYCGDLDCFEAKAAAHEEQKKNQNSDVMTPKQLMSKASRERRADATPVTVAEDGIVHLEDTELKRGSDFETMENAFFDTDGCAGCDHKKQALLAPDDAMTELTCFNMPCFWQKDDAAERMEERMGELQRILAPWARNRIISEHVAIDNTLQCNLAAYLALGFPCGADEGEEDKWVDFDPPYYGDDDDHNATMLRTGIVDMKTCLTGCGAFVHMDEIAALAVRHMDGDQILQLAALLGMSIDSYRVDQRYLGLLALVEGAKAPKKSKPKADEGADHEQLIAWLLEHAEAVGVPADVRAAWNASQETQ